MMTVIAAIVGAGVEVEVEVEALRLPLISGLRAVLSSCAPLLMIGIARHL